MASDAGVSGLIVPDLPLEEAYKFSKIVSNHSMDLIVSSLEAQLGASLRN